MQNKTFPMIEALLKAFSKTLNGVFEHQVALEEKKRPEHEIEYWLAKIEALSEFIELLNLTPEQIQELVSSLQDLVVLDRTNKKLAKSRVYLLIRNLSQRNPGKETGDGI